MRWRHTMMSSILGALLALGVGTGLTACDREGVEEEGVYQEEDDEYGLGEDGIGEEESAAAEGFDGEGGVYDDEGLAETNDLEVAEDETVGLGEADDEIGLDEDDTLAVDEGEDNVYQQGAVDDEVAGVGDVGAVGDEVTAADTVGTIDEQAFGDFNAWDANADETVTEAEFTAGFTGAGLYNQWDADRNQMLNEDEFHTSVFSLWDADRSGYVEQDEYTTYGNAWNVGGDLNEFSTVAGDDDLLSEDEFGGAIGQTNLYETWDEAEAGITEGEYAGGLYDTWNDEDAGLEEDEFGFGGV